MKHRINMFDICLPSQHLVFVFDAPERLLMRPASVPAFCLGMRKWMKLVWLSEQESAGSHVSPRYAVIEGLENAQSDRYSLCWARSRCERMWALLQSWRQADFESFCQHSPGMPMPSLYVTHSYVCVHLWRDGSAAKLWPSSSSSFTASVSPEEEMERQSERLSATAGSEITNSIVLR